MCGSCEKFDILKSGFSSQSALRFSLPVLALVLVSNWELRLGAFALDVSGEVVCEDELLVDRAPGSKPVFLARDDERVRIVVVWW